MEKDKQNTYQLREHPRELPVVLWLFSFNGRIGRKQFWQFHIPYLIFNILTASVLNVFVVFVLLLTLWPLIAVTLKRVHDMGDSGKQLMYMMIPVFGWMYIYMNAGFYRGSLLDNQYGRSLYKD